MSRKKKTIALLGEELEAKRYLANSILEEDCNKYKSVDARGGIEIYENDRFRITNGPIKDISHPDLSLIVINKKKPKDYLLKQIDQLETTSENPFVVVLPLESLVSFMKSEPDKDTTRHRGLHAGSRETWAESPRGIGNRDINIILLGQTGTGKSACGNTILGKTQFPSELSSTPVTTKCEKGEVSIDGVCVTVIDTPDYDEVDKQSQRKLVSDCKALLGPGPCVYLLVTQLGRFTDGERDILKNVEKAFSQKIRDTTIILFTHGESLKREKTSLEAFVNRTVPLKELVEQCGNRYHVFENKESDRQQVRALLQKVHAIIDSQDRKDHTSDGRDPCVVC